MRPPSSARPRPRPEPEDGAQRENNIIGQDDLWVQPPMLFDRRRLAREMGVSIREVDSLRARGLLPAPIRLGGRLVRWSRVEIGEWILAGCPSRERWEAMRGARGDRS